MKRGGKIIPSSAGINHDDVPNSGRRA